MTTVGYGDIVAGTNSEKAYAVFAMLLGATVFGYIVGSMASLVGKFDGGAARYKERMDELRDYMEERSFTKPLRKKVKRFYEFYFQRRSAFDEPTMLNELSENLKRQIVLYLNKYVLLYFEATHAILVLAVHARVIAWPIGSKPSTNPPSFSRALVWDALTWHVLVAAGLSFKRFHFSKAGTAALSLTCLLLCTPYSRCLVK